MDNSSVEKRKFKRYNVTNFVATPIANRVGRLINISKNGVAILVYNDLLEPLPEKFETYFLTVDKGFLIENLPLK